MVVLALAKFSVGQPPEAMLSFREDASQCLGLLHWPSHATQFNASLHRVGTPSPFPDALFAAISFYERMSHRSTLLSQRVQPPLAQSATLSAVPEERGQGGKTLWECLPETGFQLDRLFAPLLVALHARIPALRLDGDADDLPDLTISPERDWAFASDTAAAVIMDTLPEDCNKGEVITVAEPEIFAQALRLLLARTPFTVSARGVRALAACLQPRALNLTLAILTASPYSRDPRKLTHILRRIRSSMILLPSSAAVDKALAGLSRPAFHKIKDGEACLHRHGFECFWAHRDLDCDEFWSAIRDIYMDRAGDLVQLASAKVDTLENWMPFNWANCCRIPRSAVPTFLETLRQLLLHATNIIAPFRIYSAVVALKDERRAPTFSVIADGIRSVYDRADEDGAYDRYTDTPIVSRTDLLAARRQLVHVFTTMPSNYNSGQLDVGGWNYIRVFLLHLEIYRAHCPLDTDQRSSLPTSDLRIGWDKLWAETAASLRKFAREDELKAEEQCELAVEALTLLNGFEGRIQQITVSPPTLVEMGERHFPEELYAALVAFVPEDASTRLAGFNHIQERLPGSHRPPSPITPGESCTAAADPHGGLEGSGVAEGQLATDESALVPSVNASRAGHRAPGVYGGGTRHATRSDTSTPEHMETTNGPQGVVSTTDEADFEQSRG